MHEATARGICRDYMAGKAARQLMKEYDVGRASINKLLRGEIHPEIHALFPGLRPRTLKEARQASLAYNPPPKAPDFKAIHRDARRYRELKDLGLLAQLGIIDEDD